MEPIEQIDSVLNHFVFHNSNFKGGLTVQELHTTINGTKEIITEDDLVIVMQKLLDDKLIADDPTPRTPVIHVAQYKITWDGKFKNQKGGYQGQATIEKSQKTISNLTYVIALGATIPALYYLIEIIKWFCICI